MKKVLLSVLITMGVIGAVTTQDIDQKEELSPYKNISVEELKSRLDNKKDLVLLDVRTPEEFDGPLGHLEGAILIPVQELEFRIDELDDYQEREIIVYCRSGNRSRTASELLSAYGFQVTNLEGGMKAWNAMEKLPQEKEHEKVNP
ncbi:MAG: rhodanese-like domain-containing protein [Candidatus Marinimicrobia bacterium]|nr:rhodanese-like domain-containing protein [Candidatus Neomarinimicrobiota bacterium]